jgi:transposase
MRDRDLYSKLLGIQAPWAVRDVQLPDREKRVEVFIDYAGPVRCPDCGEEASRYDTRERRWRHLDTMQYQTVLIARVPRASCEKHGVKQVEVPWAEPGSHFTALFEALVIDWLQEASILAVQRLVGLTWEEVDGIMQRAVRRGLERRKLSLPMQIGVDEKSFQKHHEYVTVVSDHQTGNVIHVADGRGKEVLQAFYGQFSEEKRAAIDTVSMDMWGPYIETTLALVPGAADKIAFDKFHVAKHLGDAVDRVRRSENKDLRARGDDRLKGTKYSWLKNPKNFTEEKWTQFSSLREGTLRTAKAWAMKETAMGLWDFTSHARAKSEWTQWCRWVLRCRIEPMKEKARMVRKHLYGVLNAVVTGASNARAEGLNSVIQWVKYTARGFRNRVRFRNAIYFHLGGLDLYPTGVGR